MGKHAMVHTMANRNCFLDLLCWWNYCWDSWIVGLSHMKHMSLEEWDRRIAPFLATIGLRSRHINDDAKQISAWVDMLPFAPDFPTEAISKLEEAHFELQGAANRIKMALYTYSQKEKVK